MSLCWCKYVVNCESSLAPICATCAELKWTDRSINYDAEEELGRNAAIKTSLSHCLISPLDPLNKVSPAAVSLHFNCCRTKRRNIIVVMSNWLVKHADNLQSRDAHNCAVSITIYIQHGGTDRRVSCMCMREWERKTPLASWKLPARIFVGAPRKFLVLCVNVIFYRRPPRGLDFL